MLKFDFFLYIYKIYKKIYKIYIYIYIIYIYIYKYVCKYICIRYIYSVRSVGIILVPLNLRALLIEIDVFYR